MRWRSSVVLTVVSVSSLVSLPGLSASAAADTLSVSQQIKITATVMPARYIIINAENQIQQIISNTSEANVTPTLYQDAVRPENARLLTPEITHQADALLKDRTIKPGILYDRALKAPVGYSKNVLPLLASRK